MYKYTNYSINLHFVRMQLAKNAKIFAPPRPESPDGHCKFFLQPILL